MIGALVCCFFLLSFSYFCMIQTFSGALKCVNYSKSVSHVRACLWLIFHNVLMQYAVHCLTFSVWENVECVTVLGVTACM